MGWRRDFFLVTDDPKRVDVDRTLALLESTYWGARRPRSVVVRMIAQSLCFTLYDGVTPIGFGRSVTDCTTVSWIADIVVDPNYRNQGLGKWLMGCMIGHPVSKERR